MARQNAYICIINIIYKEEIFNDYYLNKLNGKFCPAKLTPVPVMGVVKI